MIKRYLIKVYGIVQGIGYRPFVSRLADSLGISGDVCNKGSFVEIHAQGEEKALEVFYDSLTCHAPKRAAVILKERFACDPVCGQGFNIKKSEAQKGQVFVSPDIGICDQCARELYDPNDKRYLHPFINCTDCGPRLTILKSMPYDRARTSMGEFKMCGFCSGEYADPSTRRYHAQPVCCNDCGPKLFIHGTDMKAGEALTYARDIIREGGIVAIKGIGGFHLCCDATDDAAVRRLRGLKKRPAKPFAIMARDIGAALRECEISKDEEYALTGPQKPIVLLKKRRGGMVCDSVAPDNPKLGVMLPYAPLHMLIFDYPGGTPLPDFLVMTSGNPSGAPICIDGDEASGYISEYCDAILDHDRKIIIRADDTVMDFRRGRPYMVRRSRGYAPLPIYVADTPSKSVVGVGGELKNAFCIAKDGMYYVSPHIGDLADARGVDALKKSMRSMAGLLEISPEMAACDMHPLYNSSAVAGRLGVPCVKVQHHFAHILSCMAENGHMQECIGVAFDGTGYGTDGTIWGGEFLIARPSGFERIGHVARFRQAGGDAAAREGWRIAVSLIYGALGNDRERTIDAANRLNLCFGQELNVQLAMLDNMFNTVISTSMGRIFDAISAILGLRRFSTFEGEAACALEYAARRPEDVIVLPESDLRKYDKDGTLHFEIEMQKIIREIISLRLNGARAPDIAAAFHEALAHIILKGALYCKKHTGIRTVALSGGVFQNTLLTDRAEELLCGEGFSVLTHSLIPPNDGGISLGQAVAAAYA